MPILLLGGLLLTAVLASGWPAALYVVIYAVTAAPGLAAGWALFGRRHGAGWIAGLLIGYGVTQLALWVPIVMGMPSRITFLASWGLAAAALVWLGAFLRTNAPLVAMPVWTASDTRGLVLIALLAPALMAAPYRNLGAADREGTRYYRAYFTADFFWHTALASEIGKFSMPPRNPYLESQPIHYYWTYFLLPSVVAQEGPRPLRDVEASLKSNAISSGALVFAMIWLLARLAVPRAGPATLAAALGIVAASAEGMFVVQQLIRRGQPLAVVKDLNIDAITAWQFGGLRIDCLPRSIFYNPQHSMSCALALIAMLVAARGLQRSTGAVFLAGLALGLSTCLNPFIGGVFSLIFGVSMLWHALLRPTDAPLLFRQALAAIPVAAAIGWSASNGIFSGAGDALTFGLSGFARRYPFVTLLLSAGPVLVPALGGLPPSRRLPAEPARVATVGVVLSLLLLYFVALSEASWVGFRAGQILLLFLPVLIARTFVRLSSSLGTAAAGALAAGILIAGLPTTVIDVYNAQDIGNRHMAPGFPWTVTVTRAQQEAFRWIRRATPENAVVQMEPVVRGRAHWSLIPTFAQRRMSAGMPISLLPIPDYEERSERVRGMFATTDAAAAAATARRMRIKYIYVDDTDRRAYPDGVEKFRAHPEYFMPVYRNAEVSIYFVQ